MIQIDRHHRSNGESKTNGTNKLPQDIPSSLARALYSESAVAKIWKIASKAQQSLQPPTLYPEYTGKDGTTYVYRDLDFWTSGFFPGSLYLILERLTRYSKSGVYQSSDNLSSALPHSLQFDYLCRWWTANLHQNALKRDTHDLGFMIAPWAMKAWDLHRSPEAFNSLIVAAHSLASRYDSTTRCIRSWDVCITNKYSFTDTSTDFLVIIDSMLNLDLIFWAAKETSNVDLYEMALAHAETTQKTHIREDDSTFHVANFDAKTGDVKSKFTNQGYSDESCWARGQAWGILGFMQTFKWTKKPQFLATARALADYFIQNLPEDGVPYWDFSAPITKESPRDTSAAMVAACGMLLLYEAFRDTSEGRYYLEHALKLVESTIAKFMCPANLRFQRVNSFTKYEVYYPESCPNSERTSSGQFDSMGVIDISDSGPSTLETILGGATINNYEFAPRRWANHGLVYADYYFLLFGNMLLKLGMVDNLNTSYH